MKKISTREKDLLHKTLKGFGIQGTVLDNILKDYSLERISDVLEKAKILSSQKKLHKPHLWILFALKKRLGGLDTFN